MPSCVSRESIDQQEFVRAQTSDLLVHHLNHIDPAPQTRQHVAAALVLDLADSNAGSPPKSSRSLAEPSRTNSAPGSDACSLAMITLVTATSAPMVTRERSRTLRIEGRGSRIGNLGLRIADLGEQVGFVHQAEAAQGLVKVSCPRQRR